MSVAAEPKQSPAEEGDAGIMSGGSAVPDHQTRGLITAPEGDSWVELFSPAPEISGSRQRLQFRRRLEQRAELTSVWWN